MSLAGLQEPCGTGDTVRDYLASRLSPDARVGFEEHFFRCDDCWSELTYAIELRAVFGRSGQTIEEEELLEGPRPQRVEERPVRKSEAPSSGRGIRAVLLLLAGMALAGGMWLSRPTEEQPSPQRVLVLGETATQFSVRVGIDGEQVLPSWPQVPGAQSYVVELRDRNGEEIIRRKTPETSIAVPRDEIEAGGLFYCRVTALDAAGEVLIETALQGISIAPVTGP